MKMYNVFKTIVDIRLPFHQISSRRTVYNSEYIFMINIMSNMF